MFFHIILTGECNSQCRYCFGEALEDTDNDFEDFDVDYSLPKKLDYDIGMLDRFCRLDPDCVLTFYGGEPLLCVDEIRKIMDNVKAEHFMMQTNGTLLDRLEPEYANRFRTILVSLDGDETLTDYYRGRGTYRHVVNNLKTIKHNGFKGELIARMTVMEQTDIHKQVTWLVNNDDFPFSSVHWQLNAGFWKNDFARRNFTKWSRENYNPQIRRLAQSWVNHMERNGVVLRLYPFLGIAHSILSEKKMNLLRCGGGWINYAIQTDGYIIPCPTMWGMKDYYLGHINDANPMKLKQVFVGPPCTECNVFMICGGRCLYANVTKRWVAEAYSQVCDTVRSLIDVVTEAIPKIKDLIHSGKISQTDFQFTEYNGCEIIP
jgi:putative peptide-modifying radical SAM enzyme